MKKSAESKFSFQEHKEGETNIYVIESDEIQPKDIGDAIMGLLGKLYDEKQIHEMLNKVESDDLVSVNDVDFSGEELMEYVDITMAKASTTFLELKDKEMSEKELVDFLENNSYFDDLIDECYWGDINFSSKAYDNVQNLIKEYSIKITEEMPEIEEELHNLYQNAEKGLS